MKPSRNISILIAAGGTGGHLLPAKQLGDLLKKRDADVLFMGKGFQKASYFQEGEFIEIASGSIRGKTLWGFCQSMLQLLQGVWQTLRILRARKVDIVIGFGSYHSFPVLAAAKLLRLPLILFEANSVLGRVNRFFAKKADLLALHLPVKHLPSGVKTAFVDTLPWVKPEKRIEKEAARKALSLDPSIPTFLIFGGSQGASYLNQLFLKAAEGWHHKKICFQVIHLTGTEESAKEAKNQYARLSIPSYVRSFEKQMPLVFSASDFVVCRSGASTVAELIFFEKPALLIPYPYAAENHQEENARFFVEKTGGGTYVVQKDLTLAFLMEIGEKMLVEKERAPYERRIREFKNQDQEKARENLMDLIYRRGAS